MAADVPTAMQAIRCNGHGPPEVLEVVRVPVPRPGPGELLVEVASVGVNRPDVLQRRGVYPPPPGVTEVPGLEVAGRVVARGPGAHRFAPGDPVCALVAGGGYAEFCLVPEPQALPLPPGVPIEVAGAVPETFFTVWTNVFERGGLRAGETFLVHGGSSGIGTTAIQLAAVRGATVLTTVGSARKAEACRELGAKVAIDYRNEDFVAVVRRETGGRGVDLILDMVGGSYVARNLDAAAVDGRIVQIAWLEGSLVTADFTRLMTKRLTWTGSTLRPRTVEQKGAIARALEREVWPLFAAGRLRVPVYRSFPLAEAAAAHALMESGEHIGKILLLPRG